MKSWSWGVCEQQKKRVSRQLFQKQSPHTQNTQKSWYIGLQTSTLVAVIADGDRIRRRWCHICLVWKCMCVCVFLFAMKVIKTDWPQRYSKSLLFCCCSIFHHKDETWCHMCNYWERSQPEGLIYGVLPRITSTIITECMRKDVFIFNNGNHDVRPRFLNKGFRGN